MANIYDMSDAWNDAGTTFTAIKMNVTETAAAVGSLLMDLQIGGASKFKVNKFGNITAGALTCGFNNISSTTAKMNLLYIGQGDDTVLVRDAANTLAQRNGANAQTFNIYNTYTDSSNYERGFMKWNSNVLEIGTAHSGTGNNRKVLIKGSGIEFNNGNYAGGFFGGKFELAPNIALDIRESSVAPAALSDTARIFAQDNGSGKTQLMVQFGSGAAQQIAIEP